MSWYTNNPLAQVGDLVELVGLGHKYFLFRLIEGGELQTHRGVVKHNALIGQPWGSEIFSHIDKPFFLLQPSLNDLLRQMPRNTQILYPKEIGYLMVRMGIGPGMHVLEAGTGSGALTTALSYYVGATGHVTTYEVRPEMQRQAMKNLDRLGLSENVTFKLRDIAEGFEETGVDALFLDVPNPYDYMTKVRAALKLGGFFGCILPTTNQVSRLLTSMRYEHFAFTEVVEIMLRYYKPEPDRLRPTDRMVAHTGYLIFARPVLFEEREDAPSAELLKEIQADDTLE